jgi:hypothetical protein
VVGFWSSAMTIPYLSAWSDASSLRCDRRALRSLYR